MENFYFWPVVLLIGVILGCFIKPWIVANVGIVLMGGVIVGMLISAYLSNQNTTFTLGVAGMLIPAAFGGLWIGAVVGKKIKGIFVSKTKVNSVSSESVQ